MNTFVLPSRAETDPLMMAARLFSSVQEHGAQRGASLSQVPGAARAQADGQHRLLRFLLLLLLPGHGLAGLPHGRRKWDVLTAFQMLSFLSINFVSTRKGRFCNQVINLFGVGFLVGFFLVPRNSSSSKTAVVKLSKYKFICILRFQCQ